MNGHVSAVRTLYRILLTRLSIPKHHRNIKQYNNMILGSRWALSLSKLRAHRTEQYKSTIKAFSYLRRVKKSFRKSLVKIFWTFSLGYRVDSYITDKGFIRYMMTGLSVILHFSHILLFALQSSPTYWIP